MNLLRRRFLARAWIAICGLAVLAAGALHLRALGPLTFRLAPTILSRTGATPQSSERAILFLRSVEDRVPAGATIALVRPEHLSPRDRENAYMSAVGLLPRCRVVDSSALASDSPPEYVASFERPYEDSRYRPPAALPFGFLSRRR